jgi:antitoxin HicB
MRFAYPCTLMPEVDGGFFTAFPDVPEALTGGRDRAETLDLAGDALAVALGGYVQQRRDIPIPGPVAPGQVLISLPPVVAAKLALYTTMRDQGISKVALAAQLGVSESAVRKLSNPDHRSHIGKVEAALKILGRTLVVEDKAA